MNILRAFALTCVAFAVIPSIGLAQQPDLDSANYVMPGCRQAIAPPPDKPTVNMLIGETLCTGMVWGVWDIAENRKWVCSPGRAIITQGVRVVVQYIDARPARMDEQFPALALEALRAAWPCR